VTTRSELILAVQAVADNYYAADPAIGATAMIALGTPGTVVDVDGQKLNSGMAWAREMATFPVVLAGLADWLDGAGIGEVASIKGKVNDLCASLNQLIADYNASIKPTTAQSVPPLS